MLAGKGVEDRDVEPFLFRRLACLDQADLVPRFGEADRDRPAARAGADDDVVELGVLWSADSPFLLRRS